MKNSSRSLSISDPMWIFIWVILIIALYVFIIVNIRYHGTSNPTPDFSETEKSLMTYTNYLDKSTKKLNALLIQQKKNRWAAERLGIINPQSFEDYCNKNKTSPEEFIVQEVGGQVTIKFNDLSSRDRLVGIIQTKAKIDLLVNTPVEAIQIVDFKERVTIVNPDERFAGYIQVENTGFSLVPLIVKK